MKDNESLALHGMQIAIERLTMELAKQRQEAEAQARYKDLPEWVTLKQAAALKGGPTFITYEQKSFLMPCCGKNSEIVGGRRCWHRDDVIVWLGITDKKLKQYANKYSTRLPDTYEKRSAG